MTLQKEVTGLCVNCMHKEHCTFLATAQDPVICCEEYDILTPDLQRDPIESLKENPYEKQSVITEYNDALQGLCINCEHNSSCKSAGQPGGVWHCEEYQ